MSRGYVWVVDDDSSIRWVMEKTLSSAHIKCETFADAESVLLALERETPDVLVSDIRMPGMDGIALLNQVHQRTPELPVIIMTAHSDLDAPSMPTNKVPLSIFPSLLMSMKPSP